MDVQNLASPQEPKDLKIRESIRTSKKKTTFSQVQDKTPPESILNAVKSPTLSPFLLNAQKEGDKSGSERKPRKSIILSKDGNDSGSKKYIKEEEVAWEDVFSDFIQVEKEKSFDLMSYTKKGKVIPHYLKDELVIRNPLSESVYNSYLTNKSFKEYFSDYLNGSLSARQIVDRNNFPRLTAERRKKIQMFLLNSTFNLANKEYSHSLKTDSKSDPKKALAVMLENIKNQEEKNKKIELEQKIAEAKKKGQPLLKIIEMLPNKPEKSEDNPANKTINKLREIVRQRINERKDFNRDARGRDVKNLKFFRDFYDITNELVKKIINNDLSYEFFHKKYYDKVSSHQVRLDNMNIIKPNDKELFRSKSNKETSLRALKEDFIVEKNKLKYNLNKSVENFLDTLQETKKGYELYKKEVCKKGIKRIRKQLEKQEKLVSPRLNSPPPSSIKTASKTATFSFNPEGQAGNTVPDPKGKKPFIPKLQISEKVNKSSADLENENAQTSQREEANTTGRLLSNLKPEKNKAFLTPLKKVAGEGSKVELTRDASFRKSILTDKSAVDQSTNASKSTQVAGESDFKLETKKPIIPILKLTSKYSASPILASSDEKPGLPRNLKANQEETGRNGQLKKSAYRQLSLKKLASTKYIEEEQGSLNKLSTREPNLSVNQKKRINLMTNYELQTFDYLHNSQIINQSENLNNIHIKDIMEEDGGRGERKLLKPKFKRGWKIRMPNILDTVPKNIEGPQIKRTLPNSEYYFIKRNYAVQQVKADNSDEDPSNSNEESMGREKDDDSLVSMTEVTLDRLYGESIDLQKKILYKKKEGFGRRIKQLVKLQDIQTKALQTSLQKLS